jgi:hypothetical protein
LVMSEMVMLLKQGNTGTSGFRVTRTCAHTCTSVACTHTPKSAPSGAGHQRGGTFTADMRAPQEACTQPESVGAPNRDCQVWPWTDRTAQGKEGDNQGVFEM